MPNPGDVAYNSTIPLGSRTLDAATFAYDTFAWLADGLVSEYSKSNGDVSKIGMPASWPYGPIKQSDFLLGGKLSPAMTSKLQAYANSPAAAGDKDVAYYVYEKPASTGQEYIAPPLSPSEQLAREQFEYTKAKNALSLATGGGSSSGVRVSSSTQRPPSSSGGGGGSSSTDYEARLAYEASSNNLDYQLAKQKQDLQLALMQKQFDLDNDPNNPKLQLERDKLAQDLMMFQQSLAQKTDSEEKALQLQRAKTISDYAANPGDAVAREYFLRQQGAQPLGTPVDIFTGQQAPGGQMTLSELMQKQAPLLKPYMGPQVNGSPVPTTPPPTTPHPAPAPEEPVPAFARGTGEITPDGWTKADKFITGDHPMGMPNPEMNQVRVRNGQAETKVVPLSQMMGRGRMPMYARGTGSDINTNSGFGGAEDPFAGMDLSGATQNQAIAYQPSTAVSPSYNSDGQSAIEFGNPTNPYDFQATSGNPVNASTIEADPYFGTAYQGMSPDATITNGNSAFYGMTAADAFQAELRNRTALGEKSFDDLGQVINNQYTPMTVVGPIGGYTTGGWTGGADAQQAADMAYGDSTYTSNQYMRPINQVNNQIDAGILTGAQMAAGGTQSANPGAPNYIPPEGWPTTGTAYDKPVEMPYGNDDISRPLDPNAVGEAQPYDPNNPPTATDGKAQGPTGPEPGGVLPQQNTTYPNSTVQTGPANPQGYAPVTAAGTIQFNGATFDVKPGDFRAPDGTWLRLNPVINDYSPLLPSKVTQVGSEAEFWKLPPAEQQKILTGQQTGYALNGDWKGGLLAGLGQPGIGEQASGLLRPDQFMALSDEEKRNLIDNPPTVQGSSLPGQTFDKYQNGPMKGQLSSLIRLSNPEGAMSSGQPLDYASYMVGPNEAIYNRDAGIFGGRNAPVEYNKLMYPWAQRRPTPAPVQTPPATPPPPPTGTTPPPPTGTGAATPPPPTGTTPPPPATGTTPPPPATGTTPPPTTGTTPPPIGPTSTIQDIIAALSYGGDVYQNLPALQLLSGLLSQGQYDTVSNAPVDVAGLPVSLPSANQAANYTNLAYLQQNSPDAFALLNSLYTAGNVPLSTIMAIAKARAPLGTASETSLIST